MTNTSDPRQTLRDLEQQRAALEHEEYMRALEAQRPALERQRIAAGIQQVALEVAEQDLQADKQRAAELWAANDQAADALEVALNQLAAELDSRMRALAPSAGRVNETFEAQQRQASLTRARLRDALFQHGDYTPHPRDTGNERQIWASQEANRRADLPDAVPLDLVLRAWVSQEPDTNKRRLRAGLAYILAGELHEPDQPISRDQMRHVVRQRRQQRRAFNS